MDKIPGEIITHIGHFLTRHDLYQLILVCKSFYTWFLPRLYHHIRLPLTRYGASGFSKQPLNEIPVRHLAHAVIRNPALAQLVRSLDLYPNKLEGERWRGRPMLDELPEETLKASLFPYGTSKRKYWRKYQSWKNDLLDRPTQNPERIYENAWLGLLLLQVKNLEQLTIWLPEEESWRMPRHRMTRYLDWVIHWARDPKLGILTRLAHVYLRPGPAWLGTLGKDNLPLDRLIPFLNIPSLRSIHVMSMFIRAEPPLLKRDLPLTHIDFQAMYPPIPINDLALEYHPIKGVQQLLSVSPNLQSFTWRLHKLNHPSFHDAHDFMNPAALYTPLHRSQHTLRELNIALESLDGETDTAQNTQYPHPQFFGPLAHFSTLETVNMRLSNLMHFHESSHDPITPLWEVLPASLRVLYLRDCLVQSSRMLYQELEALAARAPIQFPDLRNVAVQFALREAEPGLGCEGCVGDSLRGIEETEYGVYEGVGLLPGRFGEVGVEFWVMPRGEALPFPSLGCQILPVRDCEM